MIVLRGYIAEPGQNTSALNRWVSGVEGGTGFQDDGWAFRVLLDRSHRVLQISNEVVIHDGRVDPKQTDPTYWNGAFLAFGTGEPNCLPVRSDRIGTVPLFWARYLDGVVFSSRLVDLLDAADFGPDPIGVLQMVLLDQPLGERTLLEGVNRFPPAARAVFTPHGLTEDRRYWQPYVETGPVEDTASWVEEGVAVLRAANERVMAGKTGGTMAWPVTGGFDSRCMLGLNAPRLTDDDIMFHVTDLDRYELPTAQQVSQHIGKQVKILDPTTWMRGCSKSDLGLDTGEFNVGHWRLAGPARDLRDRFQCTCTIDGYLLDTLLKPNFIREGSLADVRDQQLDVARYRAKRLGTNATSPLISACLEASAADYPEVADGRAASQWYTLYNRSRRMVHGIVRVNQNFLDVRTLGLDGELINFAMRLPWELRKHGRLYRQVIAALDPGLAQIPHDKSGLPLESRRTLSISRKLQQRGRYYVNRMWPFGKLFHGKETRFEYLLRRDPAFYAEVRQAIGESGWIREALGSDIVPVLDRHHRRASLIGDVVGALLNVALLEQYATGKRRTDSVGAFMAKMETSPTRSDKAANANLGVG